MLSRATSFMPHEVSLAVAPNMAFSRRAGLSVSYVAVDSDVNDTFECSLTSAEPRALNTIWKESIKTVAGKTGACAFPAKDLLNFRVGKASLSASRLRSSVEGRISLSAKVKAIPVAVIVQ